MTELYSLRLDYFVDPAITLYQNPKHFCFNTDSVLLAQFAKIYKNERAADIGTNNGALLLYCDQFQPAFLAGFEILTEAADLARLNMETFARNPWQIFAQDAADYDGKPFDVILCNPPYFTLQETASLQNPNMRHKARNEYSMDLEKLARTARKMLKSSGRIYIVYRPDRLAQLIAEFSRQKFGIKRLKIVYDRRDEQAKSVLVEAVPDANCRLQIEKPGWIGSKKEQD
jgi:tRNA1(Val) A37 N6-methylase TrmN6